MKNLLLLFLFAVGAKAFSQATGDVVIYSNSGEKFYVVLNGIRQNNTPETNVKVQGLTNDWYGCKIISSTNTFEIEKNIPVKKDTLITYQVSSKKGKYKLTYFSETPMRTVPVTSGQAIVTYSPSETATTGTTGTTVGTTGTTTTVGTTGTTTSVGTTGTVGTTTTAGTTGTTGTTTTTVGTTGTTGTTESVNVNMNVSENGMTLSVTGTGVTDPNATTTTTTTGRGTTTGGTTTTTGTGLSGTTTTSSTTTTTSSSGDGRTTYYEETTTTTTTTGGQTGNLYQDEDVTVTMTTSGTGVGTTSTTTGTTTTGTNTSYTGGNCYMSDADFEAIKKSIAAESFSEDRMRVANMAAKNKCMSVTQIKEIMLLFSFSEEQLAFAKTAYDTCTNKNDYFQLMDVFSFSSDKEELETYINNR